MWTCWNKAVGEKAIGHGAGIGQSLRLDALGRVDEAREVSAEYRAKMRALAPFDLENVSPYKEGE